MLRLKNTYAKNEVTAWPVPNHWDGLAFLLVLALIVLLAWGAKAMSGQYHPGQAFAISLDFRYLPYYALRSVLRMFIALGFSVLFTLVVATAAARSSRAERIIIPAIDILQSVPVLGFLSITVLGFMALFPGSLLGPEAAAVFAIFISQVWNMTLSFYQSLRTVPNPLREVVRVFHLSPWQRFWRLDVPFAMPGLLWNTMISMSGSWVFLVASEAITVANHHITLPGIGSYIALAIAHQNVSAIFAVIVTMGVVIFLYDQLFFRPLIAWSEKFKMQQVGGEREYHSWVLDLFLRTRLFRFLARIVMRLGQVCVNYRASQRYQRARQLRATWFSFIQKAFLERVLHGSMAYPFYFLRYGEWSILS